MRIFLLVTMFIFSFSGFSYCREEEKPPKKIIATVELGVNYIFHMVAVPKIGFDSDYEEKYKDTIYPDDIIFLKSQEKYLSFLDGKFGELVNVMIFWPAYLNLDTEDKISEYFSILHFSLDTGYFEMFLNRYKDAFEHIALFYGPITAIRGEELKSYKNILKKLGEIYVRNFPAYKEQVWKHEKAKMDSTAELINDYFASRRVIENWEEFTGKKFKYDTYRIMLCTAIKGGPGVNSLSYERNVFYGDHDNFDYYEYFISHETGTHIMIDIFTDMLSEDRFDQGLLYVAYENLCKFYNLILTDKKYTYKLGDKYMEEEFQPIYKEIYDENPGILPEELIEKGMEKYIEKKSKQQND